MRSLESDLVVWAEDRVNTAHCCGYSGINIIEKILKDPGISTQGTRHRIHWWPKSRRIYKIGRAMHQISAVDQVCLIIKYGRLINPDNGQIVTDVECALELGFGLRRFEKNVIEAQNKLSRILKGYDK